MFALAYYANHPPFLLSLNLVPASHDATPLSLPLRFFAPPIYQYTLLIARHSSKLEPRSLPRMAGVLQTISPDISGYIRRDKLVKLLESLFPGEGYSVRVCTTRPNILI